MGINFWGHLGENCNSSERQELGLQFIWDSPLPLPAVFVARKSSENRKLALLRQEKEERSQLSCYLEA